MNGSISHLVVQTCTDLGCSRHKHRAHTLGTVRKHQQDIIPTGEIHWEMDRTTHKYEQ